MRRGVNGGRSWVGALLGRPRLLVVTVALLVAAPVLILGQASENETRARLRAEQIDGAARSADVISSSYVARVLQIRDTLASLALSPRPDASPIGLAVQRGDIATLQAITDTVQRLYPHSVLRVYIGVPGQADTIVDAMIVAASPSSGDLVGRRLSDLDGPASEGVRAVVGNRQAAETGFRSVDYPGTATVPSVIAASIPIGRVPGQHWLATIVAEVDDARTFADAAEPSLSSADDAYLLMLTPDRRLIGRARGPTAFPWLDVSGDPFVQLIGPTTRNVVRAGVADPLGAGSRLIASAPLSLSPSYSVLFVRDTSELDREVDAALSQLAIFRLVLVALLLGSAYLTGLAGSQVGMRAADQERLRLARDLHDLLGHSLSLIAIKSQLARRLLPPGDTSRAANEIADVEHVARESLQDVRRAIDGYRQPSFSSALAGARAALAAAGIDGTIELSAGPLPTAVDAALAWAVREGVTNVIRHSGAATCSIRLARDGRAACLEIIDSGPPTAMNAPGNGLRGLQERVAARGGRLEAGPLPHGGFRLYMSIPV